MDALSIIIGGMLGGLAGWAISSATAKKREANRRSSEAVKAIEKMSEMKGKAKNSRGRSLTDMAQGFLLYTFGFIMIMLMVAIMLNTVL